MFDWPHSEVYVMITDENSGWPRSLSYGTMLIVPCPLVTLSYSEFHNSSWDALLGKFFPFWQFNSENRSCVWHRGHSSPRTMSRALHTVQESVHSTRPPLLGHNGYVFKTNHNYNYMYGVHDTKPKIWPLGPDPSWLGLDLEDLERRSHIPTHEEFFTHFTHFKDLKQTRRKKSPLVSN